MVTRPTVFILGAGASAEVQMPTGPKLAEQIASCLNYRIDGLGEASGNVEMYRIANRLGDGNAYHQAAAVIRRGVMLANSIDDFLDTFEDAPTRTMGKAAIARCILAAERNCDFYVDQGTLQQIDFTVRHNNWFVQLMRLASPGAKDPGALFHNVSFIVFNYDRCLEQFLLHAFMARYNLSLGDAIGLLRGVDIVHPYGLVGQLPLMAQSGGVPFGANPGEADIVAISKGLKTYTDEIEDNGTRDRIHSMLLRAKQLVFLGFGFHKRNMQLLRPPEKMQAIAFATAYGASDLRQQQFERQIEYLIDGQRTGLAHVSAADCSTLIYEYGPTIFRST
jgi:hypothetical protein